MLSYEWSVQPVIKRIRDSLVRRGYRVWLDIDQMRGSTMDVSHPLHLRCQLAGGTRDPSARIFCSHVHRCLERTASCSSLLSHRCRLTAVARMWVSRR